MNASADARKQTRIHVPDWESMARDLQDTLDYLGPESACLAQGPSMGVIEAIHSLIVEEPDRHGGVRRVVDDESRPFTAGAGSSAIRVAR